MQALVVVMSVFVMAVRFVSQTVTDPPRDLCHTQTYSRRALIRFLHAARHQDRVHALQPWRNRPRSKETHHHISTAVRYIMQRGIRHRVIRRTGDHHTVVPLDCRRSERANIDLREPNRFRSRSRLVGKTTRCFVTIGKQHDYFRHYGSSRTEKVRFLTKRPAKYTKALNSTGARRVVLHRKQT
jgi:hypothetical protein